MAMFIFKERTNMNTLNKFSNLTLDEIETALNSLRSTDLSLILSTEEVESQRELLMNAKQQKILETYPIRIWQASNGTWKAHIPDNTKPRNRKVIQGSTKENLENNILKDYNLRKNTRLIFSNYFLYWLFTYKANYVHSSTLERYSNDYVRLIKGTKLDSMKITTIKRKDVMYFINDAINQHELTTKGVRNLKTLLNGVFELAVDEEEIKVNPMANLKIRNSNIKPEKLKHADTEVFNEDEQQHLIKCIYANYKNYKPIISLAILLNFQLGLRVGELCTLKRSDIDFKTRTISIQRMEDCHRPVKVENGKLVKEKTVHQVVEGRTKKNSNRVLDLTDEALYIIELTIDLVDQMGISTEFLFPDKNGNHTIRQRVNDCLAHYCEELNIPIKSSHKIRKTVISNLVSKNFDIDEVMRHAGHSNKTTTYNYYVFTVHTNENRQERLTSALSSNCFKHSQPDVNPNF